jgi:hypothetical protein
MRPEAVALIAALTCTPVLAGPAFAPVEVPAHVYSGGWEHFVGGGVAVLDCDGDGLGEVFAAGGASEAVLLANRSTPGGAIHLEEATPVPLRLRAVIGAYPLDIDGDGWQDLVVLRAGENMLLRGGPGCTFTTLDDIGFTSSDRWTTAFSATWERDARLPTLAFGNYVDRADPEGPFRACDANLLYRPDGGTYGAPLPLTPGHCALSMLFSDWGRQGRADLRISNDRHYYVDDGQEQMWAMETQPRLLTEADGWRTHRLWGMGIAARDLSGDGLPEVFLTSMGDQRLQQLTQTDLPTYADVPFDRGSTAHRPYTGGDGRPSTGWHVVFGDVQNDGIDDVFITKGNVDQMPDSAMDDPNNLLLGQPDGRFVEAGARAGLASLHRGRGGALVDLNGDGLLDVIVNNRRAPLEVWQNVTSDGGNWVSLSLSQHGPNISGIGAWIELRAGQLHFVREVTVGGGHAGGVSVGEHFGIGTEAVVRVRVFWPDGTVSSWVDLPVNRRVRVLRSGAALVARPY